MIIVGLFTANIPYWWTTRSDWSSGESAAGISFLELLVVIAGFILLITSQYPRALFDLLIGLNRWVYRVTAYVALMRDEYPPFRLDQGQHEPGDVAPDGPVATPGLVGARA